MSAYEVISVHRDGAVCRLTLNRPERLNALGEQLREELHDALGALAREPSTRVVVVAGAGRAFSAGADLKDRRPMPASWAERRHAAGAWQRLLDDLESIPQATVAVLHGHVVGGAVLLAAACDIRVADASVSISIPELALGIPLTWAGLPRLVREIGLPRTRDLVMTGRVLSGMEAHGWGFVQRLAGPDGLEAAAATVVAELAAMPSGPLATTRAALAALGRAGLHVGWADADLLGWALGDPEAESAAAAYVGRRLAHRDESP